MLPVAFESSPARLWRLALLGVGMTALSLAVAVPLVPGVEPGDLPRFAGIVGVLFFGACTAVLLRRALAGRAPVVTLTDQGVRDARVSARPVPWTSIESLGTWSHSGQEVLVLKVSPEAWEAAGPTRLARMTRSANRKLGADGYLIAAQGLAASAAEIRSALLAALETARRPG